MVVVVVVVIVVVVVLVVVVVVMEYVFDVNDGEFAEFTGYILNVGRSIPDNVQDDCREVDIILPDINLASLTWLLRSVSSYQSEQSFRANLLLPLTETIIGPNAYLQTADVE